MKLLPLLSAALVLAAASAQAAPHGIKWVQGAKAQMGKGVKSGGNLQYYGGPVISSAKVYAVFWTDKVAAETKAKIGPFYENILDSGYMDWLGEYDTNLTAVNGRPGTGQHIGRGRFMGAITITPANASKKLTDAMLQTELDAQMAAGTLAAADDDTLYMLYFPSGYSITIESAASCSSFCGYHEGFKSARTGGSVFYGVMPACGFGCGGSSAWDAIALTSSHECLEAVTDPFPTPGSSPAYPQAWNTAGGDEVADLCQEGASTVTGHGIVSKVSWEWDNASQSCLKGPWTQARSIAAPRAPSVAAARTLPIFESLRGAPARAFTGR
ncbi:MAG: hypothetical protein PHS14_05090 [Elusimicrobia bacterium]|nr:hypothetical protein [Elusimicrobiota bacterium]